MNDPAMPGNVQQICLDALDDIEAQANRAELLLWDGRLDNACELTAQLHDRLCGEGSGALAVAAYERWGVAGLARLIGDWSLVIRDWHCGRVVLASDFSGVRPLYYSRDGNVLRWSTDLAPLVRDARVDTMDERYIAGFLAHGGAPTRTPYAGVRSVRPGHALSIGSQKRRSDAFWRPPMGDCCRYQDPRRYDEQLFTLFREAVAVRLATPQPVVAELSGGLDSSSIVCMANELIRSGAVRATRLHTVSYVHERSIDLPFITEVEQACSIAGFHLSTVDAPLFDPACAAGVTPFDHCPLQQAAAAVAREQGATTYLTGQGGDLLLGNYIDDSAQVCGALRRGQMRRALSDALVWSRATRVPAAHILARAAFRALASFLGGRSLAAPPLDAPLVRSAGTSLASSFCRRLGISREGPALVTDWHNAPIERQHHFRQLALTTEQRLLQPLEWMRGLAYTHPFFHRPLVEFLMTVPADVLCGAGEPRRLMRSALSGLWPARLRGRRSKGLFTAPYFDAFRGFAATLLATKTWQVVERGWVDGASLRTRLERLCHGLECNLGQLRQILLLEHWLRDRWQNAAIR